MYWMKSVASIYRRWLKREQIERELDDEVQSYFQIVTDRLIAGGLSREQALRAAPLELEGPEQIKEKVREARMGIVLETTVRAVLLTSGIVAGYVPAYRASRIDPMLSLRHD